MYSTHDSILVVLGIIEEDDHELQDRHVGDRESIDGNELAAIGLVAVDEDALRRVAPPI